MVATNFQKAVDSVLASEGGYVDHPRDSGGATNRGITRAALARYRGTPVSKAEMRLLGVAEATVIYRENYWNAVQADALPRGLDFAVFDCAVNSGPRRAVLLLQETLGISRDGIFGPITLRAAATCDVIATIGRFSDLRLAFLSRLATFSVFGQGWRRRVETVRRNALLMAKFEPSAKSKPSAKSEPSAETTIEAPSARPDTVTSAQPSQIREPAIMLNLRTVLLSRPIWANLVGLASIALSLAGIDTTGLDAAGFSDSVLQVVAGASFIASSLFQLRRRNV